MCNSQFSGVTKIPHLIFRLCICNCTCITHPCIFKVGIPEDWQLAGCTVPWIVTSPELQVNLPVHVDTLYEHCNDTVCYLCVYVAVISLVKNNVDLHLKVVNNLHFGMLCVQKGMLGSYFFML